MARNDHDFVLAMIAMGLLPPGVPTEHPPGPMTDADRALPHHDGHTCSQCGFQQYWCSAGNPNVQHAHTCPDCGFAWQHGPLGDE